MNPSRESFAALRARWVSPLFLHLNYHGFEPWAINSRIVRADVAGVTNEGMIEVGGFSFVDGASGPLLADLIALINTPGVELRSDDGDATAAWIAAKWPAARPRWGGATQLARLFRHAEPPAATQPFVLEPPGSQTGAGLAMVLSEEVALRQDGQFDVYQQACAVLAMLATQGTRGYPVAPDAAFRRSLGAQLDLSNLVHPAWSVISQKGHAIIIAKHPPLTMLVSGLRSAFPAPDGLSWVRLAWRQPELRLWAIMSQDAAFARLVRSSDPYSTLGQLLDVPALDRDTLKGCLYHYLHGHAEVDTCVGDLALRCRALFPTLTRYLDGVGLQVASSTPVYGWQHRRLTPPGSFPLRRLGQQAQATAVNIALGRLCGSDPAMFGLSQVIPIFDTVAFCLRQHNVPDLVRAVDAFSLPLGDAGDGQPLAMETTVEMGDTWGTTKRLQECSRSG